MRKLIIFFMFSVSLYAHDFWIEPSSYSPKSESLLKIRLWVGNLFHGLPYPRNPKHIERFVLVHAQNTKTVLGFSGKDPAGLARVSLPGIHIIGYQSKKSYSELAADKFELFLREEGQEQVLSYRRRRREQKKPGREFFFRYAKSLIWVENTSGKYGQALGFPLELVLQKNPFTLAKKEKLPVQVLFKNKPLAHALVSAIPKEKPEFFFSQRSNQKGEVFFDLDQKNIWLLKVVHVVRAKKDPKADWHSYWASLTFSTKNRENSDR